MSRLRIYWPDGPQGEHSVNLGEGGPVTLSFKLYAENPERWTVGDLISRARVLYENKRCPNCSHPVIEPIELDNAVLNRNRIPIPGTATLVGFRCDRCQVEWPTERMSRQA